jgi:antitoxin CcdA
MAYSKPAKSASKRATNVSLSDSLLLEAKALGINISQAAERGLAQAIEEKQTELWLVENRTALDSSNDYVKQHGLPLARYRQF